MVGYYAVRRAHLVEYWIEYRLIAHYTLQYRFLDNRQYQLNRCFIDCTYCRIICSNLQSDSCSHLVLVYFVLKRFYTSICSNLLEKTALEITSTSLQSKLYRELNDFDNHLDDIELDWRNPFINEQLSLSTQLENYNNIHLYCSLPFGTWRSVFRTVHNRSI